jgi:hypothetical protein
MALWHLESSKLSKGVFSAEDIAVPHFYGFYKLVYMVVKKGIAFPCNYYGT